MIYISEAVGVSIKTRSPPASLLLNTPENTITYHNALCLSPQFCISIVFSFYWGHFNFQEKLKTMLMQNFAVTNKEHYGMLWYFWSGRNFNLVPRPQFFSLGKALGKSLLQL